MQQRKIIASQISILVGGAFVGWLYDDAERGLLVASLMLLAWHLRQLLTFEQAVRDKDFDRFRYGDGIWSQLYSRFAYARSQSRRYKKNYRNIVKEVRKSANALPDGGIVLNDAFEIVLCNKAAEKLVGFQRKRDRGQRVDNILRDPAFTAYLDAAMFDDDVEFRSPMKEGDWLRCRIVPYGTNQFLLTIQDITAQRRLAVSRRDFVANASHELRSPLTVIGGYLDTMAGDKDTPAHWKRPIQQMQSQAARMNRMIGDLLELSRLESSGEAKMDEVVDVCEVIGRARSTVSDLGEIPEIIIICQSEKRLVGVTNEIESVVVNLLTNAIRHTVPDGEITMSWVDGENAGAKLSVQDSGSGIAAEDLSRLTERFFRADAGRSRDNGGVGLGLAIVKHVLVRHGAELSIESELEIGSTFTCHFPADRIVH